MKLNYTYKIYWFENEEGWLESAIENLKEKYGDSKIKFEIATFKNADGIEKITPETDIDVLLMDFNLSGVQGDEIIVALREKNVLCDIIFYSQKADFDDGLRDREGVQATARGNLAGELNKKIDKHKTLIESVSTLRGNFITSAIDLEIKMNEIVAAFFKLNPDKEVFFKEEIIETDFFNVAAKLKVVKRIGTELLKSFEEEIKVAGEESKELLKKKKIKLEMTFGIFKSYDKEIMDVRNTLAHSKDEIHDDGSTLFRHNTKGTKYVVNEVWVREKMKHLVVHSINLDRLLSFV
jgi:CheY-like chemotaxis protein